MTGHKGKLGCCCSSVLFLQTNGWPQSHREGFYLSYRTVISCLQNRTGIRQQACIYLREKRVSASQRHGKAGIVSLCEYIILLSVLDMKRVTQT